MPHVHPPTTARSPSSARRLAWVLAVTVVYTGAEAVGGWLAQSLALLADAGHMLTDNLALGLALLALWTARRPPDPTRTYGYHRVEILAALVNSVVLVVVSLMILWEAWERFRTPLEVHWRLMGWVALGGLAVNAFGAWVLHGRQHGLNVRAAYLHVLGDLLSSVGTLLAAGLIALTGWVWVDPAVSVAIAGVIIFSSTRLVLDSVNVLLEGAPSHIDSHEVRRRLLRTAGVCEVHDLHLWSLSGGTPLLSAHLVIDHSVSPHVVLREALAELRSGFGIEHATLQIEPPDFNIYNGLSPTDSLDASDESSSRR